MLFFPCHKHTLCSNISVPSLYNVLSVCACGPESLVRIHLLRVEADNEGFYINKATVSHHYELEFESMRTVFPHHDYHAPKSQLNITLVKRMMRCASSKCTNRPWVIAR